MLVELVFRDLLSYLVEGVAQLFLVATGDVELRSPPGDKLAVRANKIGVKMPGWITSFERLRELRAVFLLPMRLRGKLSGDAVHESLRLPRRPGHRVTQPAHRIRQRSTKIAEAQDHGGDVAILTQTVVVDERYKGRTQRRNVATTRLPVVDSAHVFVLVGLFRKILLAQSVPVACAGHRGVKLTE